MKKLVILFRSRNDLFLFANVLRNNNIPNSKINTPASIGSTCSLSLQCDMKFLYVIKQLLLQTRPKSFYGLFILSIMPYGEQVSKLM